jgi:hypothetical protein
VPAATRPRGALARGCWRAAPSTTSTDRAA